MPKDTDKIRVIGANDVSTYVVCAEAWRLKRLGHGAKAEEKDGRRLREEWVSGYDLSTRLKYYAKVAYLLLVVLLIVAFLLDRKYSEYRQRSAETYQSQPSEDPFGLPQSASSLPSEVVLPLIILGVIIFVWDLLDRRGKAIVKETGFSEKTELIALKGSGYLPAKHYHSPKLGLSSKPDALLRDGEFIIPVDRKPLSKNVRDRHVVQLLMHMRLIEEIEGKRPPYGILLLGTKVRIVKIKNTEQKQRWLDSLLEEMWSIIDGIPAVPTPAYYKCKNCDVEQFCSSSAVKDKDRK